MNIHLRKTMEGNMSNITLLDQNTINKIAAGEVIERPAAVVKELIENAIDAGANAITIEIKEGGISFIRVTDNGMGIQKDDIKVAFLRHATSKIKTIEDLISVSSLGFRGEALASIASVAQVELVTKTSEDITGIRYVIEGGEEKSMEEIGCPNGTTFIIRNLFFNTPARRKFLKSATTEASYIGDLIERLAVSHPNVSFKFITNNKIKLHTSGNGNLKDILYNVYGRDISANLLEVKGSTDKFSMVGFIAKPVITRGNRNYENYFINGRYIKNGVINKAIEEAFKPYIMSHRYPFTALHFTIESDLIDVNVHPTKMELRFNNNNEIYHFTHSILNQILAGKELIPDIPLVEEKEEAHHITSAPEPFEINRRKEIEKKYENHGFRNQGNGIGNRDAVTLNLGNGQTSDEIVRNNEDKTTMMSYKDKKEIVDQTEIGHFDHVIKHPDTMALTNDSTFLKEENNYKIPNRNEVSHGISGEVSKEVSHENITDSEINPREFTKDNQEQVIEVTNSHQSFHSFEDTPTGEQITIFEDKLLSKEAKKHHRIVGEVFSTYWIVEYNDKMFMIDQHAAHEKVMYERILKAAKEKEYLSQILQPPIIITLNMREEEVVKTHMNVLNQLGFEIEHFGGKEYSVRAVPSDMYGIAQEGFLLELIADLVEDVPTGTADVILEKIASMSCKAAVKGNNRLSYEEAVALIDQLLELDNPYNCPHGRPVIISMSKYEIEKKFKRIV